MAAKPIVDGIEREHGAALSVVRLNIQEPAAEALADRFGFQFTPTFLLFDAEGEEVFRTVGSIDPAQIRRALEDA